MVHGRAVAALLLERLRPAAWLTAEQARPRRSLLGVQQLMSAEVPAELPAPSSLGTRRAGTPLALLWSSYKVLGPSLALLLVRLRPATWHAAEQARP